MKKLFLLLLIIFCVTTVHAKSPKKYVEKKYGSMAVFFDEDIDDQLDNDKIGPRSPIFFFNSTNHDISFEFHEIKTSFGNVTSDKIFPLRGRNSKITIGANQYLDTSTTLEDIEHIAFVFSEKVYKIYVYPENRNQFFIQETNTYSLVFEFADE
jgi:hypothetical protein